MSTNNYIDYELYCINKHINDFNQITYHWTCIPDEILVKCKYFDSLEDIRLKREKNKLNYDNNKNYTREYGLDGISIENTDNDIICHGLQMKYWNKDSILDASHLGTFFDVIINKLSPISKGYLYYSCEIGKEFYKNCINGNKIILIKTNLSEKISINEVLFSSENNKKVFLRDYQLEAIHNLKKEWNGNKLLVVPCGMGKTLICSSYCREIKFSNIIIISPTIALSEQNGDRFSDDIKNYNIMYINCYSTRDKNKIKDKLNKNTIFSVTYDSFEDIFTEILEGNKEYIDMENSILIIDEAHNLINRKKIINNTKYFYKCLLVTATPPYAMYEILNCSLIYEYKLKDAIEKEYICDYEIYLPYIKNINIPFQLNHLKIIMMYVKNVYF